MDTRATCLNCMDGVLSNQDDISEILRSIAISVNVNKSTRLFIVGHYDCRGNPIEESVHRRQIIKAVTRLKTHWPNHEIVGLWVNREWEVEVISTAA